MDAQALAIAGAIALIAALVAALIILARRNARLDESDTARFVRARELEERLETERRRTAHLEESLKAECRRTALVEDRRRELERELRAAGDRRGLEEGELVVVNTRRPDDQSLEGIVLRELPDGGILLAGAELLVAGTGRGRAGEVERLAAGEVFIPADAVGWVQRHVTPRPSPRQRAETAAQS